MILRNNKLIRFYSITFLSLLFLITVVPSKQNHVKLYHYYKGPLKKSENPMQNLMMPTTVVSIRTRVQEYYPPMTIFSVPYKNSVGTFDIDNEFSILEFDNKNIKKRTVMKYDPNHFPYSPSEKCGYTPINNSEVYRWAIKELALFNMDKIEDIGYLSDYSNDYTNVVVYNKDKYLFLCKMDAGFTNLRMVQLNVPISYSGDKINGSKGKYRIIAEKKFKDNNIIGATDFWINNKTIFAYDSLMLAFDERLQPVDHPVLHLINEKKLPLHSFAVHPSLPFAITRYSIYDEKYNATNTYFLIRWNEPDKKQRMVPLPLIGIVQNPVDSIRVDLSHFEFSPDGRWLLIKDYTNDPPGSDNPYLYVFPVQPDNPLFLGPPICLGNAGRPGATKQESACWTTDPVSYVMCDGMVIYKWEMPEIKSK